MIFPEEMVRGTKYQISHFLNFERNNLIINAPLMVYRNSRSDYMNFEPKITLSL